MAIAETGRVTVEQDVVFGTGGGRDLKCNVYMPPQQGSGIGDKGLEKSPWSSGSRRAVGRLSKERSGKESPRRPVRHELQNVLAVLRTTQLSVAFDFKAQSEADRRW